jgi:hypothetical protein
MVLPERAKRFFSDPSLHFFSDPRNDYQNACKQLGGAIDFDPIEFASSLAAHLDDVIEAQDIGIGVIATGGPTRRSRDQAVVDTLAWKIASSEEGKRFAREHGFPGGNMLALESWLETRYPLPYRRDPVSSWRDRSASVRVERNPHKALKKYREFMIQTAAVRAAIDEAHCQVDQYIDMEIERLRGN